MKLSRILLGSGAALGVVALAGWAYVFWEPDHSSHPDAVPVPVKAMVDLHNGLWVASLNLPGIPVPVKAATDVHVDPVTRRITVYSQGTVLGNAMAPAQMKPGACTGEGEERVCGHPDAVFLNASGQELAAEQGEGSWWVRHSWVLGGESYLNCVMKPAASYDDCLEVKGVLLDDGLTMKIGGVAKDGYEYYNTRAPLIGPSDVRYVVTTFGPTNTDAGKGTIDLTPTVKSAMISKCHEVPSPLDGVIRNCPEPRVGRFGS